MIVDLNEIEGSRMPFAFSISPAKVDLENPTVRLSEDVRVSGEVVSQTAQVEVGGQILGQAEIDCTRCLEPVVQDLDIEFKVAYLTADEFSLAKEHEVTVADLDADVLDGDRIDLRDVVREQILLDLPEQSFCRPDCKGLCTECGANLNLVDCSCIKNDIDPRWAGLKNLLGGDEETK